MPICARMRPITTKKYLRVAFMDGVATAFTSGSRSGTRGSGSSACDVWYQTMPAMPASRRMIEATVHIAAPPVSWLPTRGSCGQLLVYESPGLPGRSVEAAHDDQKKKAVSAVRSRALGRALGVMAYFSRSVSSDRA